MLRVLRALTIGLVLAVFSAISARAGTTTIAIAISAAGNPVSSIASGTVVTLTATVLDGTTPRSGGQVDFCDADATFCTDIHLLAMAQITHAGTATYKFIPGVGTHHYKAVFLGTRNAPGSASTSATLTVTAPTSANSPTTTVIVPTGHPGDYTLTATVNTALTFPPTGTVSFFDTTNANFPLGNASLIPGDQALSLQRKSAISSGNMPLIADFNGDGIPDIATFDLNLTFSGIAVTIHLGNGDGTFTTLPGTSTGTFATAATTADFNADGIPDLAVAGDPVVILLGNGDGTFTTAPATVLSAANAIVAGDVNNDGVEDLVVTSGGAIISYLGRGNGTFTQVAQPTAVPGQSIYLADLNQDGELDLAVEYYASYAYNPTHVTIPTPPAPPLNLLTILTGNGDGTFNPGLPVTVNTNNYLSLAASVVIADFNGDGILDFAVITADEPDRLLVLLGFGNGDFAEPIPGTDSFYYNFAAITDFNHDGLADLVVFPQFPDTGADSPNIITLLGNGDGTFTPGFTVTDPGLPSSGLVADFDGDGNPDVAAMESDSSISLYLTQATATSTATITNISVVGTGTHYVDALYSGDSTYTGSLSPAVPLTADTVPTTLALSAAPAAGITVGQSATLTANLSPHTAQQQEATGFITFSSNGTALGTIPLAEGAASLTTTSLPAGSDDLVATYSGDTNFRPSTATDLIYAVAPLKAQTITFPQPPSPVSVQAAPITLVATASSGLPVTLKVLSGPATLNGSVLTVTGIGTVVVAADQPGNTVYAAAPEVTRSILVTPPAIISLGAVPNLVFLLSPVTFTAAISPAGAASGGIVTFLDGTQPIGTAIPQGGTATIVLSTLPFGPHSISATWSGTATYAGASSPSTPVTVEDFSIAFPNPQETIFHGGTATFTLLLAPVGGPSMAASIGVSLSGQPTGSEMTVNPTSTATGVSNATVTVVIATPNYPTGPFAHNSDADRHGRPRIFLAILALGGVLLPFTRRAAKRRARTLRTSTLLAIASAALILGATGCGSGWNTETFQIQATATSGALSHIATATLTSKCSNGQPACPVVSK